MFFTKEVLNSLINNDTETYFLVRKSMKKIKKPNFMDTKKSFFWAHPTSGN